MDKRKIILVVILLAVAAGYYLYVKGSQSEAFKKEPNRPNGLDDPAVQPFPVKATADLSIRVLEVMSGKYFWDRIFKRKKK